MAKEIYLLGSLNADLTVRAPYMPERGETLKGDDFMITAGGKGANQAYACAALGGKIHMAGCVGKDIFGDMLVNSLSGVGADTSHIRRAEDSTGVAVITVVDGDNRIILHEGANGAVTREDCDDLLKNAKAGDIFITQLETPAEIVLYALQQAKGKGLYTILNPAPATADKTVKQAVAFADLVTPNRKELKLLSEKEGLEEGCSALLAAGAGAVLATLGEKGSHYVSKTETFDGECISVGAAVDTTAAGDTFCGGLAVRLAEGAAMQQAVRFAALCSGIGVTRRGAQISIPTRAEVEETARRLKLF